MATQATARKVPTQRKLPPGRLPQRKPAGARKTIRSEGRKHLPWRNRQGLDSVRDSIESTRKEMTSV